MRVLFPTQTNTIIAFSDIFTKFLVLKHRIFARKWCYHEFNTRKLLHAKTIIAFEKILRRSIRAKSYTIYNHTASGYFLTKYGYFCAFTVYLKT